MAKYITFNLIELKPKTKVWGVFTSEGKDILGKIKWYPRWRQYVFFSHPYTIYSQGCLKDIAEFIEKEMKERKK